MIFPITGIRKQYPDFPTKEELDRVVEADLAQIPLHTQVQLQLEPNNSRDGVAIEVYRPLSTSRLGYVSVDYWAGVYPVLDERGLATAELVGWDGHVTLFAHIDAPLPMPGTAQPLLPPIAIPRHLRCPMLDEERAVDRMLPGALAAEPSPQNDAYLLEVAEKCIPGLRLSACAEDKLWRALLVDRLKAMSDAGNERAAQLYTQLDEMRRAIVRSNHVEMWQEWIGILEELVPEGDYHLTLDDIERWMAAADIQPDHSKLGDHLYYKHYSRSEMYVVAQIWILRARLKRLAIGSQPSWEECIPPYLREGKLYTAWCRLRDEGLLTPDWQVADNNRTLAAVLVSMFCEHCETISATEWSHFEKFWNMKNLRSNKQNLGKERFELIRKVFDNLQMDENQWKLIKSRKSYR